MKLWHRRPIVHAVTDARPSLTQDIGRREKRYLIQMAIRTICLVLAVVLDTPWPIRALFIAGAIFLPYVAVIGANERGKGDTPEPEDAGPNQNEIPRHRREIGS
ncbi:hypothetical protein C1I98_24745 [Spongiactinospora gelatinilytica]|uniref:DUF3099 domain-containing protein n=1 Tax=Spongiactinospora gelatinilytica TaxID=2666298 RepID=A0A2W2GCR8_9ACTN|nr:DUF3099 domain-containing protein [Spongiactinospora gelatinilytica]PZG38085.1 hypothetical protein C1I98_24745 [Spongiactinospora gelatinilytica]